jgi:hypothetical protein
LDWNSFIRIIAFYKFTPHTLKVDYHHSGIKININGPLAWCIHEIRQFFMLWKMWATLENEVLMFGQNSALSIWMIRHIVF